MPMMSKSYWLRGCCVVGARGGDEGRLLLGVLALDCCCGVAYPDGGWLTLPLTPEHAAKRCCCCLGVAVAARRCLWRAAAACCRSGAEADLLRC